MRTCERSEPTKVQSSPRPACLSLLSVSGLANPGIEFGVQIAQVLAGVLKIDDLSGAGNADPLDSNPLGSVIDKMNRRGCTGCAST